MTDGVQRPCQRRRPTPDSWETGDDEGVPRGYARARDNLHGDQGEARLIDRSVMGDVEGGGGRQILRVIEGRRGAVQFARSGRAAVWLPRGAAFRPWIRRHRLHSAIGGNDALVVSATRVSRRLASIGWPGL